MNEITNLFKQTVVAPTFDRIRITIGSPEDIRQMLEFSARHGIAAQIEKFPMAKVNEAITRLKENKARYRIVLEN